MKSGNSSDIDLGVGIAIVGILAACLIKQVAIWPLLTWIALVFVGVPIFDKAVLAASYHDPMVRWIIRIAIVLLITGVLSLAN